MSLKPTLSQMWSNIQCNLFPTLESHIGELTDEYKKLVAIFELVRVEESLPCTRFNWGRPVKSRSCMARAFIAKMVFNIPNTKQLIRHLKVDRKLRIICGWEIGSKIPSESTFSRGFAEFAESSLADKVHQLLITKSYKDQIIWHLVKDSTPIIAREKPLKKEGTAKERKKKMGERYIREKKGELLNRRQKQLQSSLDEMINELPTSCDIGMKKNAQGYTMCWKGYKLHAAVDDNCIPISVLITSASLNDSEVAIPLAEKSRKVAKNFYDLMDAAYDENEIKQHSVSLEHMPIIDRHSRSTAQKKEKQEEQARKRQLNFLTAEDKRYKERMPKERFNALYKDYYGGRNILYRGHAKVSSHIMFGVLAMTASTLLSFLQ